MLLLLLSYLGGVLTIISPCILPVLPFVFARAGQPFLRSGLPMLAGMALMFMAVATLAAVGGGWAVQANQYGRWAAILLLGFFGLALLFPALADRAMRPLVAWGSRLSQSADKGGPGDRPSIGSSFLLGIATGLLWAPCAGPILGLILTGAALQGASIGTSLLLLAYALGAATSLALALLIGGPLFKSMKHSLGAGEWIRRGLGALVLIGVAAIALGLDTNYLAKISTAQTNAIEQSLARTLGMKDEMDTTAVKEKGGKLDLPVEGVLPPLDGITHWINSPPLTREQLRGKVVLIDFWTYSCINCLRSLPYVRAWAERYKDDGLVVIGVHAPEFAFEKDLDNVATAVRDLDVTYPVAVDNDYAVWRAFKNRYWPAHYFIDAQGRVRYHHFGEGNYARSEQVIRQLLAEAGRDPGTAAARVALEGVAAAAAIRSLRSPETYIGYARAANFMSPGGIVRDRIKTYAPAPLTLNQWALDGRWTVERQQARLERAGGGITYRFHARDLHLVLGNAPGKPVRFRIRIDGKPPGDDHGVDVDAAGNGTIDGQRLYQLVRQKGPVTERLFEIEFLDPGVEAFAFTFG
ncbi:cytochrome c biogenesis protein DipZ [Sphingosinicella rhizophila]|uniref:Cytochrome c biogenesis protein CcdA n=1 Tax=Sphingosinicella rhizophila TaxID=3050082 RepID=A0ABU3QBG0_9SPHN|nr:cytochrome c biogenesis protein CcdA [Sphingosinicella sp. GR2756]MDT9600484.1 cytochrome c biogenesis protein CcdA [Sphingosinicella sp. GR2756]